MSVRALCVLSILTLSGACTGSIDDGVPSHAVFNPETGEWEVPEVDPETGLPVGQGVVRAPLRRLTRFEYNNVVADLFGDMRAPANALPSDQSGNGFGNDADAVSTSSLHIEKYAAVAESVAAEALRTGALRRWSSCVESVTDASDARCAQDVLSKVMVSVFRRAVTSEEVAEFVALFDLLREDATYNQALSGVLEALLQSPEFLYRPEFGTADPARAGVRKLTGYEAATRLSFFLWGTTPDQTLLDAAAQGELDNKEGIAKHAERMVADERAKAMVRHFFGQLLHLSGLPGAVRDAETFPDYSPDVGAWMQEETHRLIESVVFEGDGSWQTILSAPYTFLNAPLAAFYGLESTSSNAESFERVDLSSTPRRGVLLQGGFLTASTHSNFTSPVKRGGFIARELLCIDIPFPDGEIAEQVTPPDPYGGATARERYSQHSEDQVCATCHRLMDPAGLALENFDAVGRWRESENDVTIDARGEVPGVTGEVDGATDLVLKLAEQPSVQSCLAEHWMEFAYGRSLDQSTDADLTKSVVQAFASNDHNMRALLVALTQTDSFLRLPKEPE